MTRLDWMDRLMFAAMAALALGMTVVSASMVVAEETPFAWQVTFAAFAVCGACLTTAMATVVVTGRMS